MRNLDKFRGCLIGGAAGDALGYEVEFMLADEIFDRFGDNGITEYSLHNGVAQISDDTQMTLFTATGLLLGTTRGMIRGIMGEYPGYVAHSYKEWLRTQTGSYPEKDEYTFSWLANVHELYCRRAPGMTCLSAIEEGCNGRIDAPINGSKGCGGIMRVAPVALYFCDKRISITDVDRIGAEVAALTHGHELGYLPAAMLVHIIHRVACDDSITLADAVTDAMISIRRQYPESKEMMKLYNLIGKARSLSNEDFDDLDAIRMLGEGWVAEETLAIAVYCALKYSNDFDKAIIAAVNHDGDSDSTGAVTGNILGAYLGLSGIPQKYTDKLECKDLILEIAEDLHHDCQINEYTSHTDPIWIAKYFTMQHMRSN